MTENNETSKKNTGKFSGPIIMLISFVLIFTLLELGTRLLIKFNMLPEIPPVDELNDYDWYYEKSKFPDFQQKNAWYEFVPVEGKDYWYPASKESFYSNIVDNIRVTTDQPENPAHTIYMFGGSTLYGTEVPDGYTIPSYLQRLINDNTTGDSYRVVNLGVPGYSIQTQVARLEHLDFAEGDIIIFYDGTNNVAIDTSLSPKRFFEPITVSVQASLSEKEIKRKQNIAKLNMKIINVLRSLSRFSKFFQYFSMARWDLILDTEYNEEYFNNQVLWSTEGYKDAIIKAQAYISETQNGVEFLHFLQPIIFTLSETTEREQKIINSYGTDYSVRNTYDSFVELNKELQAEGYNTYDLTNVLDPEFRTSDSEIFFDYCHINHYGNQIIAEQIFLKLEPFLNP